MNGHLAPSKGRPILRRLLPVWARELLWVEEGGQYDAFLSYSHTEDQDGFAADVQHVLHRLGKPWFKLRARRVFRDVLSLSLNEELWPALERHLGNSKYLVLLASPAAVRSPGVCFEVDTWFRRRDLTRDELRRRAILLLIKGSLAWREHAIDRDATDALPPQMLDLYPAEVTFVDLRRARSMTDQESRRRALREPLADVAAAVSGTTKEAILSEDVRQHRRFRRIAICTVLALVALTTALGVAAFLAIQQRNEADRQRFDAQTKTAALWYSAVDTHLDQHQDSRRALLMATRAIEAAPMGDPRISVYVARAIHLLAGLPTWTTNLPVRLDTGIANDRDGAYLDPSWRYVVARSPNQRISVWDLASGTAQPVPAAFEQSAHGVDAPPAFSPDGQWVAVATWDVSARESDVPGWLWTWNLSTGHLRSRIPLRRDHSLSPIRSLVFSGDSRTVVSSGEAPGGFTSEVELWDTVASASMRLVREGRSITGAVVSQNARQNVVALVQPGRPRQGEPVIVTVVQIPAGTVRSRFPVAVEGRFENPMLTRNGDYLLGMVRAFGRSNQLVRIDLKGGEVKRAEVGEQDLLRVTGDDAAVVLSDSDGQTVWLREVATLEPFYRDKYTQVEIGGDGLQTHRISAPTRNRVVRTGPGLRGAWRVPADVGDLRVAEDGKRVVTILSDGTASVWNVEAPVLAIRRSPEGPAEGNHRGIFLGRGHLFITSYQPGAALSLEGPWLLDGRNADTGHAVWRKPLRYERGRLLTQLSVDHDYLVVLRSNYHEAHVAIVDASSGEELVSNPNPMPMTGWQVAAVRRVDGRFVVMWAATQKIFEWDVGQGRLLNAIPSTYEGTAVAFTPDGRFLLTTAESLPFDYEDVTFWRVGESRPIATFRFGNRELARLIVIAARTSTGLTVRSREEIEIARAGKRTLRLTAGIGWASVQNLITGELLQFPSDVGLIWNLPQTQATLSADARFLAIPDERTVRVWETGSRQLLGPRLDFPSRVAGVEFEGGNQGLRILTQDGVLWRYPLLFASDRFWSQLGESLTGLRAAGPRSIYRLDQQEFRDRHQQLLRELERRRGNEPAAAFVARLLPRSLSPSEALTPADGASTRSR